MVVFGVPKDLGRLQQIAKLTNGRVWPITSAAQIQHVFYRAFGRRICQPHCPK